MLLIELPLATLFILPKEATFFKELSTSQDDELIEHMDMPLATLFIPPPMEVTRFREESTVLFDS
jgi:hypothetical protein